MADSAQSGDFVVTFLRTDRGDPEDGPNVLAQRFSSDGTARGSEFQVNTFTTNAQQAARVASASDGDFVVVWMSPHQDGDGGTILGRRYASDGSALTGEYQVNSYTTGQQEQPSVSTAGDDSFVVVWHGGISGDSDSWNVQGQRYAPDGTPQGGEFQVNSYTTLQQLSPKVSSDYEGNFTAVWHSHEQDGSGTGIFGQRFGFDGSAQGNEFQVNSHTTDDQARPSVSSGSSGDFVVVWKARITGFTGLNIRGQRYGIPFFADGFESGDTSAWN